MKGLATFCGDLECFVLKTDLLLTVLSDFKREAAHDDVFFMGNVYDSHTELLYLYIER